MPTYDYQCNQCQHCFEQVHGANEEPRPACPQCGGLTRRRIGSNPSVIYGERFQRTATLDHSHGPDTRCDRPDHDHAAHTASGCYWHKTDEILERHREPCDDDDHAH